MDLFRAMHTQRAVRSFAKKPIPDDVVRKILDAAIRAPSGGNSQRWAFLVIKDPDIKRQIGAIYKDIFNSTEMPNMVNSPDPSEARVYRRATQLAQHMDEVPLLIMACHEKSMHNPNSIAGSSIYPAVQNLMLAARGLGLGTVITTIHQVREEDIKKVLGIPDNIDTAALIPLGFPAKGLGFGFTKRRPVEEVVFLDQWGQVMFSDGQ